MPIVSLQALRLFWQEHPDAGRPLRAWYVLAERAVWRSPAEMQKDMLPYFGTSARNCSPPPNLS
ncbi:MAG: hypothetical protein KJZ86_22385 [Caldilineaceae bacterium]|nr:hypothetical protein [Caldilineaceae bacterium]HRJ43038.1 hypothetical protein [Caldilineaceae bacterium]